MPALVALSRELVEAAARFARDLGVDWIELRTFAANEDAMRFWRSLGFMPRVVQLTSATGALIERLDREG